MSSTIAHTHPYLTSPHPGWQFKIKIFPYEENYVVSSKTTSGQYNMHSLLLVSHVCLVKKFNIGDEYNPGICWSGVSCSAAIGRGATQQVADSGVSWMSALISITTQIQRFTGHSRHTAPLRTTCSPAHRPERRRHGTASFAQYSTQPGPEAARDVICLPWCMAVQQTHTTAVRQLFSRMF